MLPSIHGRLISHCGSSHGHSIGCAWIFFKAEGQFSHLREIAIVNPIRAHAIDCG
jgi:hypothetical protein